LYRYLGLVCTLCRCALNADTTKKVSESSYNKHINSDKHKQKMMESSIIYHGNDFKQVQNCYKIDCYDTARKISTNITTNNKSFLDCYVSKQQFEGQQCSSCKKLFPCDMKNKKHLKECNKSERVYVNVSEYCTINNFAWGKKKILYDFESLSVHDLLKDNMLCKDVTDIYNKIDYLSKFTSQQHACMIEPDPNIEYKGVQALQTINDVSEHVLQHYDVIVDWLHTDTNIAGYTYIQGGRLEIFLGDSVSVGQHFLWSKIMNHYIDTNGLNGLVTPGTLKTTIKNYCTEQAKKDERLEVLQQYINDTKNVMEMHFSNFSMIVTKEPSPMQLLHMDATIPNYQFILACTNNSPTTIFAPVPIEQHVTSITELVEKTKVVAGIDDNLVDLLKYNSKVQEYMKTYGNLFSVRNKPASSKMINCGTVISLPGTVIHAGPKSKDPRSVFFYTCGIKKSLKRKCDEDEIELDNSCTALVVPKLYSKDVQYNAVTLFLEIMLVVWETITEAKHKEFLVNKLHRLIHQNNFKYTTHLPHGYGDVIQTFMEIACKKMMFYNNERDYNQWNLAKNAMINSFTLKKIN
jgi:hypothetical protein